jgi:hypothetical protein
MIRECNTDGEKRHAYSVLVGIPQGNGLLQRPRHRWEDNIQMYLREIRWGAVNWIHLTSERNQWWAFVNMIMNLWVPLIARKFLSS